MKKVMKRFTVCMVLVVMVSMIIMPAQAVMVYDKGDYGGLAAPPAFTEDRGTWLKRQETIPATAAYFVLSLPTSVVDVVVDVAKASLEEYLKSKNAW